MSRYIKIRLAIVLTATLGLNTGCAELSLFYHNTTAYYNAYFLAKEHVKQIEEHIVDAEIRNYEKILPVFPPFDTLLLSPKKELVIDCIEKSSHSIYRHRQSHWADDAYLTLGKGRLYAGDHDNAFLTFRYINVNSKDPKVRQDALMQMVRGYILLGQDENAQKIMSYIRKRENITDRKRRKNFLLLEAHLLQREHKLSDMADKLELCLPLLRKRKEKLRIYYILSQTYERLGKDGKAHRFYRKAIRKNPSYDILLQAQLNILYNKSIDTDRDLKKVRRKYRRYLKEKKYKDEQHKIHYGWANFEYKYDRYELAMEKYNLSLELTPAEDLYHKKNLLFRLIHIHYDDRRELVKAADYYDSLAPLITEDEPYFEQVMERKEHLRKYAEQHKIWFKQDSLLGLSRMSEEELDELLEEKLEEKRKEWEKKQESKKTKRSSIFRRVRSDDRNPLGRGRKDILLEEEATGTWYFYSPQARSQGYQNFAQQWGERPSVDYWRLSARIEDNVLSEIPEPNLPPEQENTPLDSLSTRNETLSEENLSEKEKKEKTAKDKEKKKDKKEATFTLTKEDIRKEIPLSGNTQTSTWRSMTTAYFHMGKILQLDLKDKWYAQEKMKHLLKIYPKSPREVEALYLLYRNDTLALQEREYYKKRLIQEYPDSLLAKIALNPLFLEEKEQRRQRLMKDYKHAFQAYKKENYTQAETILKESLEMNTENDFVDDAILLLQLMSYYTQPAFVYPMRMKRFLQQYKESNKVDYAKKLLKNADSVQLSTIVSSSARYETENEKPPYALNMIYPTKEAESLKEIEILLGDLVPEAELGHAKMDETHSLFILRGPFSKKQAKKLYAKCKEESAVQTFMEHNKESYVAFFFISEKHLETLYLFRDRRKYASAFEKSL